MEYCRVCTIILSLKAVYINYLPHISQNRLSQYNSCNSIIHVYVYYVDTTEEPLSC